MAVASITTLNGIVFTKRIGVPKLDVHVCSTGFYI